MFGRKEAGHVEAYMNTFNEDSNTHTHTHARARVPSVCFYIRSEKSRYDAIS